MKIRTLILGICTLLVCGSISGQSRSFKLGQWVEINNAILKELNRSYVDSLPLDRIQRAGIDAMLESLDPYTVYIPEEENENLQMMLNKTYGGIGAVIYKPGKDSSLYINEPYAGSPAVKYGLQCGDRILEIDGQSVIGMESKDCSDKMKGKPGTKVKFKVKKVYTGEIKDIVVTRERIHIPDVEYSAMLNDTTGYILQSGFTSNVSSDVRAAVLKLKEQGMKKLVLDLRGNGGGLMNEAINIVSLFVPKGSLVVSQMGEKYKEKIEYHTLMEPIDTLLPIVVMVDGGSASSSEIVAGALQDLDRATIMGRRTYGKGLVQSVLPLPYNGQLKITTAKYYTPSGRCVQAIDYSHRNEDGSVGHIPDSLTKEFKTAHGRSVRDGGGITPDVILDGPSYSRLIVSLVASGVINNYALDYAIRHKSIQPLDDFHFTDYEDFINYAKTQKFDYRSSAKSIFDQFRKELTKDGLDKQVTSQLDSIDKVLTLEKEAFLRLKKDEIIPFIEQEIATRYYFQEAGVIINLRYDDQLKEALKKDLIKI